ncbi:MAG TPA: ABC transporter permease [Candidatus Egerieicola pullicola]|uniref:ABC transporter permease n=1 Tax=Candidatus Egerieicola pullicola TaxID=2840775 RepID=A0A9D1AK19_9FIRM|nr:ABC transporter permease [Candidatus Egerieicola pullicola]
MSNLLSAYFSRLWREKIFWIALAFMGGCGIFFTVIQHITQQPYRDPAYPITPEEFCFNFHQLIGVVSAIVCCLFLGREFQDGVLRNKLIAGYPRWKIYLSGFLANAAASVLLALGYSLTACLCGMPVFGGFVISPGEMLLLILSCVLYVTVYASLFTMIQMLTGSQVVSLVLCIVLTLGLYVSSEVIFNLFYEPVAWDGISNPNYPGDTVLGYLEMLYQFLPTGQGVLLTRYTQPSYVPIENVSYGLLPCYSAVLIALTTGAGLWGFSKKQLH